MLNIIRASIFKLLRDWTFRITMMIGVGLAVMLIVINAIAGTLTGESMFLSSASPSSNFGLTVPINLVVFTVSEFTYGTIRNKVIAGHSKYKVYVGLFLTGLIFTFILMSVYLAFCIGLGSAIGGFDAVSIGGAKFILSYLAYIFASYTFITALSIFFATLFRSIGGSISVVVVILVFLGLMPLIIAGINGKDFLSENVTMWVEPLYMLGLYTNASSILSILKGVGLNTSTLFNQSANLIAAGIIAPLYWAGIFFGAGALIFTHRDLK